MYNEICLCFLKCTYIVTSKIQQKPHLLTWFNCDWGITISKHSHCIMWHVITDELTKPSLKSGYGLRDVDMIYLSMP